MLRRFLPAFVALAFPLGASAQLVIAGGGLDAETQDVWQAFIDKAAPAGTIVIIPSASGSPVQSAQSVADTLSSYGVAKDRIAFAEIALLDDRSTDDVDESEWVENIDDPALITQLETASAIWFTGGDQSRTTTLFRPHGQPTEALKAIYHAQHRGAPIGGTSAGAAIMSRAMIQQGDSLAALTGSADGETLKLGEGLGFLPHGLVDQHFGERARLGRLAAALGQLPDPSQRLGFGIDENTAFITDQDGAAVIKGAGYVTVLDARNALYQDKDGRMHISDLVLHLVSAGDRIDLETLAITPAPWKSPTVGQEYVQQPLSGGGGMALQGQSLQDVIGEGLIDNAESQSVERISFDGSGRGVAYHFHQLEASSGFWGRGPDGPGRYMIANIAFDIVPVNVSINPLSADTQP
jgi:cyanophycinase